MISPEQREREIAEVTEACVKHLADLSGDIEAQYEVLDRLEGYLALIERSALSPTEACQ
jgi:hypothetical protein